MIPGGYGPSSGRELPRVVTLSIAPAPGGDAAYMVRLHEESTPIAWLRKMRITAAARASMVADLAVLDTWSMQASTDPAAARRAARRLGRRLFDTCLGRSGRDFLAEHPPTALMLDIDETLLGLPWELLDDGQGPWALRVPFGRLVSTRTRPKPERDPTVEDDTIRVLAIVDPTRDLGDAELELQALAQLSGVGALEVTVLSQSQATHSNLAQAVAATRFDVVHLSCHGGFLPATPGASGLLLADGPLLTDEILALPWAAPPYLALASACWSTRSAPGRRLAQTSGGRRQSNGVAAAFLTAGASAAAGFGWPVTVRGASTMIEAVYRRLVETRNVGLAVLEARQWTTDELWLSAADLAGPGFTFYGDVGSAMRARRDLATASPPDDVSNSSPDAPSGHEDEHDHTAPRRDLATAS